MKPFRSTVKCPAKINTFLAVGPPDSSGYHPIRTEFQAIGLFDEIEISVSDQEHIEWNGTEVPIENTVSKVLRLVRETAPIPPLAVKVTKRIPMQAGLGGGSSDAAGVLRFLKRSWPELVGERFAYEIACAVGADVPFFLVGGRARGTGYGERIEPLPDGPRAWVVVAKPKCGIDTAGAYARLDERERPFKEFSNEAYNDFARVAPCESLDLIEQLRANGAQTSLLCGSGSAVFGTFADKPSADLATRDLLLKRGLQTWTVPTLTREESLWTS